MFFEAPTLAGADYMRFVLKVDLNETFSSRKLSEVTGERDNLFLFVSVTSNIFPILGLPV